MINRRQAHIASQLEAIYAKAKVSKDGSHQMTLDPDLEGIMSNVTAGNERNLQWAWQAWRDATGPHMRDLYTEYVKLANEGAKQNGELSLNCLLIRLYPRAFIKIVVFIISLIQQACSQGF